MPLKRGQLAARRKAVGFSQDQLAERLQVDRSTVARWESGETEPQPWIRPRLARVLQVSVEQLNGLLGEADLVASEDGERLLDYALIHPGSADLVTVAHLRREVLQLDDWMSSTCTCHRRHCSPTLANASDRSVSLVPMR
jgi:transcriptional regulator with XRE-family HTH domain